MCCYDTEKVRKFIKGWVWGKKKNKWVQLLSLQLITTTALQLISDQLPHVHNILMFRSVQCTFYQSVNTCVCRQLRWTVSDLTERLWLITLYNIHGTDAFVWTSTSINVSPAWPESCNIPSAWTLLLPNTWTTADTTAEGTALHPLTHWCPWNCNN